MFVKELIEDKRCLLLIQYKCGKGIAIVQSDSWNITYPSKALLYCEKFRLSQCKFCGCDIYTMWFKHAQFCLDWVERHPNWNRTIKNNFLKILFWRIAAAWLFFSFPLCGLSDKDITNSTLNAGMLAQPVMRFWKWLCTISPPSPHFPFDLACYCHLTIPVLRRWLLGLSPICRAKPLLELFLKTSQIVLKLLIPIDE